ncbi:MAG: hypothetical protein NVSMB26_17440 [Beijerinckiaceae bacterium]
MHNTAHPQAGLQGELQERPQARPQARWILAERAMLIIGLPMVVVYAIGMLVYGPSMRDREEHARLLIESEHMTVCDKLGKPADNPDRADCIKLLDELHNTHKQLFIADSSDI